MGDAGETIEEKIVGYLHDVVEDSQITITDLSEHGFSDAILNAVDAITRRKSESWRKYIRRVGDHSIATKVKINDLKHNSDLSRIISPGEADLSRQRKYQEAIANLLEKQLFH
ncbi:GTP pyrophosphokinase [Enterococcus sp. AZ007]|uniref:GTP pyrophosphokinase n=1 Tax=Enterococcus sp. AZ007 TaxID=2774839 RepID=UPI003F210011